MKIAFFYLSLLFLSSTAIAGEVVPLFDEIPSFKKEEVKSSKKESDSLFGLTATETTQSAPKEAKKQEKQSNTNSKKPNLGRHATPIQSLRLTPIPDLRIDLDPSIKQAVQEKKFEEKLLDDKDILRRETPLNMTETKEDELSRLIAQRRQKGQTGRYESPLGKRHDANGFLLAGVGLGMNTVEVEDILTDQGYTLSRVDETLPPALSIAYEKDCRLTKKLYIISDIKNCIFDKSKEEETRYIKQMTFERPDTRETMIINFTSLATENIVYRVFYQNKGDSSLNTSARNVKIKKDRQNEFWDLVFTVYGLPDDSDKLIWGNENTSYLHAKMMGSAYDAYLILESNDLQNEDYFKWEDSLAEMKTIKTFNFVSEDDNFGE